jgi:hypothetical protein
MHSLLRYLAILWTATGLMAQTVSDLNSLVLQGDRYAAHAMADRKPRRSLSLFRIIGAGARPHPCLMEKSTDLQEWTLIYQIDPDNGPAPGPVDDGQQSVALHCCRGFFQDMVWSPLPVFDCRSLECIWITLTLDGAISQLNQGGHTRGFSTLTIIRPLHPHYPDECTFIFKCDPERLYVGISAQTGQELWTEPFLSEAE